MVNIETFESGHMSPNSLNAFLSKVFGHDSVVGETPGGDVTIHLKVSPVETDEKIQKDERFEANSFKEIPLVEDVSKKKGEFVRLSVKNEAI